MLRCQSLSYFIMPIHDIILIRLESCHCLVCMCDRLSVSRIEYPRAFLRIRDPSVSVSALGTWCGMEALGHLCSVHSSPAIKLNRASFTFDMSNGICSPGLTYWLFEESDPIVQDHPTNHAHPLLDSRRASSSTDVLPCGHPPGRLGPDYCAVMHHACVRHERHEGRPCRVLPRAPRQPCGEEGR
jgi:hypothetical protein